MEDIVRTAATSLDLSGTATPAATAPASVPPEDAEDDICCICHEGKEDDIEEARKTKSKLEPRPLYKLCMTCNVVMHMQCCSQWRARCRDGLVTGRGTQPTCPNCRSVF